jgi:hypothetical protein
MLVQRVVWSGEWQAPKHVDIDIKPSSSYTNDGESAESNAEVTVKACVGVDARY